MYPPALILEILIIWLKFSQSQASRHDWASVDWEAFLLTSPPLFLEDIKTKRHELPALIAGAWPPARGIVWLTVLSSTVYASLIEIIANKSTFVIINESSIYQS